MKKIKKDTRPLYVRLWVFQAERAPVLAMIIMSGLTVGIFANFTDLSWRNYLTALTIVMLYLLQTRTSDEKKDFEHDNKYHPDRPVQRGVVTLKELFVLNQISIVSQILLYASFFDLRILLFGLASQGYAFLTRKEFFVRDWIREHFFIYYITHYAQLVVLNLAIFQIIQPVGVAAWQLILFVLLNVIIVEVGRKMFAVEDDTTDDTFSAQLGHKGAAITFATTGLLITGMVYAFIDGHNQQYIYIVLPVIAMGAVLNSAYHYAIKPNRKNADNVKYAGVIMQLLAMSGLILGA